MKKSNLRKMKTDLGTIVYFHKFIYEKNSDEPLKCIVEFEDGSFTVLPSHKLKFIP